MNCLKVFKYRFSDEGIPALAWIKSSIFVDYNSGISEDRRYMPLFLRLQLRALDIQAD
jgi:hypothetical protein